MIPELLHRMLFFDETDHVLGNEQDRSGTRRTTYTNSKLNRAGARHCRGIGGHVTGGYSVTGAGEFPPPLLLFSSSAKDEDNMAVNDEWVKGLGRTKGKFGHPTEKLFSPWVAVRNSGSMDTGLFLIYIESMTLLLYPEETLFPTFEFDSNGNLVKGPVLWITDTGPGRLAKVDSDFRNEKGETYDDILKRFAKMGIFILGLLPNSTAVTAVMDELFRAFKNATRASAQAVYARKLKVNARAVIAKKKDLALRHSKGEKILASEIKKVNTVVTLDRSDLGEILYGELDEHGLPHIQSPIATHFTREKINQAMYKVNSSVISLSHLNSLLRSLFYSLSTAWIQSIYQRMPKSPKSSP